MLWVKYLRSVAHQVLYLITSINLIDQLKMIFTHRMKTCILAHLQEWVKKDQVQEFVIETLSNIMVDRKIGV
jgi:hypothetical protein